MLPEKMKYFIQLLRSLVFNIQMYIALILCALFFLPWMVVSRKGALAAVKIFTTYVIWSAGWIINLKTEIRGKVPTSEVLIASKHQSFLDIIMIYSVIPNGWFNFKQEYQ